LACSRLHPVIPDIKYATSGDLQIAYQVVGDGPVDVVLAFDWGSNIELVWEHPQTERFLRRVASYGRLIRQWHLEQAQTLLHKLGIAEDPTRSPDPPAR
jgi:hypothetical protein